MLVALSGATGLVLRGNLNRAAGHAVLAVGVVSVLGALAVLGLTLLGWAPFGTLAAGLVAVVLFASAGLALPCGLVVTWRGGSAGGSTAPGRSWGWRGRLLRAWLAARGATVVQTMGPEVKEDLQRVRDTRRLAPVLVQDVAALHLLACVRASAELGGAMAEAGVFAGGTARLICEAKGAVPLHLFDVFETLQPGAPGHVSDHARRVQSYFGAFHTPRAAVEELLRSYPNVVIHAGVFPESAVGLEAEAFSFVHLDLDLEEGTRHALEFFHPRMLQGGILLGDDYNDSGVRRAFDEYFSGRPEGVVGLPWGQAVVVKA
jgi:hypothetical protein